MGLACAVEDLEELVLGRLGLERARAGEQHVASCESCRRELAWLRTERQLLEGRAEEASRLAPEVWRGVAERIAPREPAWREWLSRARVRLVGGGLALATAAAALMLYARPMGLFDSPTVGAAV